MSTSHQRPHSKAHQDAVMSYANWQIDNLKKNIPQSVTSKQINQAPLGHKEAQDSARRGVTPVRPRTIRDMLFDEKKKVATLSVKRSKQQAQ